MTDQETAELTEQEADEADFAVSDEDFALDDIGACHHMLQQLAGRAPDALLTLCRNWLAEGDLVRLARSVLFWAVSQDVELMQADVYLLSALLGEAGADTSAIAQLRVADTDPYPYYAFAAQVPADLAGGPEDASGPVAKARAKAEAKSELAAIQAVSAEPDAIGLWRSWRFPSDGAPWPVPKRVFVVEIVIAGDSPAVAARVQAKLAKAGETDPQVEVYCTGDGLPVYQEFARSYGELVWAAAGNSEIQMASIFDDISEEGVPSFHPDHPALEQSEARRVVNYLNAGEPILMTTGRMDDVVDTSQVYAVPLSFRTDGTWIWTEAAAYYAEKYLLEPDAGLLAHIRANDYVAPPVDGVAVYRALRLMEALPEEEEEWPVDPDESAQDQDSAEADSAE
jgi:hypothetical protein